MSDTEAERLGFGASYWRDECVWAIYSMPGAKDTGIRCGDEEQRDNVLTLLRSLSAQLAEATEKGRQQGLREAADAVARVEVPTGGLPKDKLGVWVLALDLAGQAILTEAPARDPVGEVLERAALYVTDGFTCRRCGCFFVGAEGHPDNGCAMPTWDSALEEDIATAIRALAGEEV